MTVSPQDKTLKIFDVCNFDLEAIHVLDFMPKNCFFFEEDETKILKIAVFKKISNIYYFNKLKRSDSASPILKIYNFD